MPYIKKSEREQYKKPIEDISKLIPQDRMSRSGHLNFVITSLLKKTFGENMRYADHNEVLGVLQGVTFEFYRRSTAPYEDKKIESEGDLE